ncbi:predicted protein [Naegleria gruberi]|uniref:E1 ubiquitin-activating enzyme n=1 Tax=Naegleria gruberi TaxID=5762 RepID=D2VMF6_NAEGR|nr:uncharacterized protein NAEGRDRAFT_70116 [Naegleria gruberi]EFC41980.1 predicted protein [Naegleria gruberi]|eukprot:XP_002674724.1 predicted protein [Naegleria gruberi strain NEG-M]
MISSKPLSFVINSSASDENSEEKNTTTSATSENEMERKRYDRQMRAIGKEAMTQIGSARILVIGCGGLGVEIVKNLMLMGFKSITVFDNKKIVSYLDLNSHFYLNEDHVGLNRLDSVIDSLYELNPYCKLEKLEAETLTEDIIKKFNIVISSDELIVSDYVINISEICHTNGIKFIAGYTIGLFSSSFVDFGEGFVVKDADGEAPSHGIVSGIEIVQKDGISVAIINTKDETQPEPHNLSNDDYVKFHSIEGMVQLNNTEKPFQVKVVDVYRFELIGLDVSEFGSYTQGGYFRQVKQEKVLDFKSLKQSLVDIDAGLFDDISAFLLYNFAKMDYPIKLHYYSLALNRFISQKGRLPQNYNTEEAKEIISIASNILESTERKAPYFVDEILFSLLSYTMSGPLNPMCTMLGGLLAQEAQKACTGKFSPLFQWCYLESVNSIPDIITNAIKENVNADIRPTLSKLNIDVEPKNNRYDAQNMIFGADFQQHLTNQKVFLVGAGALGCEYLKNFAMIGLGSGPRGTLSVTDMDSIEVSNLSRQFLFREEHVGKMKSECAAKAAQKMNPSLNIRAMADRVGKETENVFDSSFWGELDLVVNALDNLEARLYVDSKCVYNQKPLLESGTLGAKANSEVILPFVTNNYGKHKDPPQKQFPECTIHRYPNMIQHTISWAKAFFQSSFTKSVEEAKLFLKSPQAFFEEKGNNMVTLDSVTMYLCQRPQSFEDCLSWSVIRFEELYNHSIKNILLTYPEAFTTSSGARFWSGSKKCPKPIEFSVEDETHLKFVFYGALLYASLFNIEGPADCRSNHAKFFEANKQYLIDVVSRTVIPKYIPNPISRDDDDAKDSSKEGSSEKPKELSEEEIERQQRQMNEYTTKLRNDLTTVAEKIDSDRALLETAFFLTDIDFEKDDDMHMEFITSASNLRARCYNIPEIDVYETKGIAGSIIPAMITTTALITGLVVLELYKVLDLNFNELKEKLKTEGDKEKFLERFSNSYVNIGIPFITQSEPVPCKKDVANGLYDIWETINISKTKDNVGTLGELIEHIQSTTKLTVTSVTYEGAILYTCFMADETKEKRMARPLDQLLNAIFKSEKSKTVFNLGVLAMDLNSTTNSDIVTLPTVVYSAEKGGLSEEEKKKLLLEKKKQLLKQKQQK